MDRPRAPRHKRLTQNQSRNGLCSQPKFNLCTRIVSRIIAKAE